MKNLKCLGLMLAILIFLLMPSPAYATMEAEGWWNLSWHTYRNMSFSETQGIPRDFSMGNIPSYVVENRICNNTFADSLNLTKELRAIDEDGNEIPVQTWNESLAGTIECVNYIHQLNLSAGQTKNISYYYNASQNATTPSYATDLNFSTTTMDANNQYFSLVDFSGASWKNVSTSMALNYSFSSSFVTLNSASALGYGTAGTTVKILANGSEAFIFSVEKPNVGYMTYSMFRNSPYLRISNATGTSVSSNWSLTLYSQIDVNSIHIVNSSKIWGIAEWVKFNNPQDYYCSHLSSIDDDTVETNSSAVGWCWHGLKTVSDMNFFAFWNCTQSQSNHIRAYDTGGDNNLAIIGMKQIGNLKLLSPNNANALPETWIGFLKNKTDESDGWNATSGYVENTTRAFAFAPSKSSFSSPEQSPAAPVLPPAPPAPPASSGGATTLVIPPIVEEAIGNIGTPQSQLDIKYLFGLILLILFLKRD